MLGFLRIQKKNAIALCLQKSMFIRYELKVSVAFTRSISIIASSTKMLLTCQACFVFVLYNCSAMITWDAENIKRDVKIFCHLWLSN